MPGTEFKNQVDNLMNILFGAGVASHATIIEQINYLVFLRSLSKKDDSAMILDSSAEKIFSGDLAKYHWDNLLILNTEVLFTTLEEIFRKLPELATDQTIRLLFRDAHVKIFDKPTLRRLVHEIEKMMSELEKEASSGHTDIFGDMYEYLLSKLSQSGTLGSFRTPRHIVKFIVDIVDPSKGETVLDPACGTAGFLVTAYEHLKEKYTSEELKIEGRLVMDKITPEERKFISQHTFTGFDSDSDMFKFGLMNLYLHKLEHPNIKRQNTLVDTAGDRTKWDIILANPPFAGALDQDSVSEDLRMNTRATEVLFLKYIVDHLSQNGRAGVIVPDGVVFNSTTAHKKIRQILVEDAGLWCVVSLPSGVFNPYAGVKTSILFFDKTKNDKNDEILFVKIENDGFDLGAQRRQIDENDLPKVYEIISKWKHNQKTDNKLGLWVQKTKIVDSGEYNISAESYKEVELHNTNYPTVLLSEVANIFNGKSFSKNDFQNSGSLKVIKVKDYDETTVYFDKSEGGWVNATAEDERMLKCGDTLIINAAHNASHVAGKIGYCSINPPFPSVTSGEVMVARPNGKIDPKLLNFIIKSNHVRQELKKQVKGIHLYPKDVRQVKIPLPPIEVQKQIVEVLDGYQKIIDGADQVIKSWKPKIDIDPIWKKVKLGEVVDFVGGYAFKSQDLKKNKSINEDLPVIKIGNVGRSGKVEIQGAQFFPFNKSLEKFVVHVDDILVAMTGATVGKIAVSQFDNLLLNQRVGLIRPAEDKLSKYFLKSVLFSNEFYEYCQATAGGGAQGNISPNQIQAYEIPLPPIEIQKQIVEKIEAERNLVEGNKKLIGIYQQKIKDKINSVWEDEKA